MRLTEATTKIQEKEITEMQKEKPAAKSKKKFSS
jgi:hypothetical protein